MERERDTIDAKENGTNRLLEQVQTLAAELHPSRSMSSVGLDTSLEKELGIDSLGRVELLHRVEKAFDVHLPDQLLATAETPRDILRAVQAADSITLTTRRIRPIETVPLETLHDAPEHAQTLLDALEWHVREHPERPHIHLINEMADAEVLTYGALYTASLKVAAALQARGIEPGQTVALMLPTSQFFFTSFIGILLAGGTPVPIYPPMRPSQLEAHLHRQATILSNAACKLLVTVPEAQPVSRLLRTQLTDLRSVITAKDLEQSPQGYARPQVRADDVALLQYTSGSTGTPKGVILTHANLLANIRAMNQVAGADSSDIFVSWLPLYHDMGLIGAWLGSMYCAYRLVVMSPLTFLAHPARWLWALHEYGGSISGAPNFAYELCVQKIDDHDLEGLDLSAWRLAFNGAEPVSPETLSRFSERFAPYGFRPEAMLPVYGLAEASLGLAFPPLHRGPRVDCIEREPLLNSGRAVPARGDQPHTLRFVSCGRPLPGHELRIVDAMGYEVPERQEGRLEFRGPSATSGYFRNPEATAELFRGEWRDSGDMAYMAEGEVYLTGRAKDIIIRAGRNLYPQELEKAVGNLPGIRTGCVAVFGSRDPANGTERLVVLAETRETDPEAKKALRRQVEELSLELVGTPPEDVVLAPPHTVLKTSSGKLRRSATRELYEHGDLGRRQSALWWQVIRLVLAGLRPQLRRLRRSAAEVAYAIYMWTVCLVLAPAIWMSAVILPGRRRRQAMVAKLIRFGLRLTGIRISIDGLERIPQEGACVIVVNHASYLDAPVLVAALPVRLQYVAKQELLNLFVSRIPMKRLEVEFVERFDAKRGVEDTTRLVKLARQGKPLVFFPEGTFGREPGLRPFRLGAFIVASQVGLPVLPVTIRGTRSILRAEQWFPHRGTIRIEIGIPIAPTGTEWSAAIALRDAARQQILRACGEPDLESVSSAASDQ